MLENIWLFKILQFGFPPLQSYFMANTYEKVIETRKPKRVKGI
jgi:hypothetical protein